MIGWVVLAVLVLLIVWVVVMYNNLVTLKNQVQNAWQQIDVQLKRRHDLIPNLLNTVKGAMEFERDTLSRVIEARARAVGATTVSGKGEAENMLTQALGKLFALVENYPDLKSNQNILQFQEELTSTENRIGFSRQFYNDIVAQFNIKQEAFPSNIVAALFGFKRGEYFQAEAAAKETPQVDLSLKK
ncbi:MAG: LemA family protein [Deltaproteobacteria bacterium]|nr:LemA family protein [Deltaproteobacteria bacterium]MBI3754981.1 LemA family protein [Deltaproteobacteria bacterium]